MERPKLVPSPRRKDEINILAFEASSRNLSAAVISQDKILAEVRNETIVGQATNLVPMAVKALDESGFDFADLTHVAAGRGPGSFTGIRVALAAAKGVGLSQNLPRLGVSCLHALAFDATKQSSGYPIIALLDSRRGTLYIQIFSKNASPLSEADEVNIDELRGVFQKHSLSEGIFVTGFMAKTVVQICKENGLKASTYSLSDKLNHENSLVSAGMVAKLAYHQIKVGAMEPLQPLYLSKVELGPKKTAV